MFYYSSVRNKRPPRLLIFWKKSTQDSFIPDPPLINFELQVHTEYMFYEEFVFYLGGSPASSEIDDNLDVFNEKMGQNFNLSWVVRNFLQTPRLFQPPRLFRI